MVIPKGVKVVIESIGIGVLSDDLTIGLSSDFKDLASDIKSAMGGMGTAIDMAGAMFRSMSGGVLGFSSQNKQMTTQLWDRTNPAQISINVEFHRTLDGNLNAPSEVTGANVMGIVKAFAKLPLPEEKLFGTGNLTPPGPSPIEGIGLDTLANWLSNKNGGGDIVNVDNAKGRGYVNLRVGNMHFDRMLMRRAEPTFSKFVDESGYPISCRVSFEFISVWAATDRLVDAW